MAAKRIKFSMNTGAFCTIWRNHITHPGADNWRKFVLNCFERFTEASATSNVATLKGIDPQWKKWNADKQYDFLSERAYAKCITIQRKLRREEDLKIDLPDGYKSRKGSKSTRMTTSQLADIFRA
jgi:hypothetical protein